ncbi:MAG: aspartate aminotransferase family protein [Kofleriaceae bacterium]
MSDDERAAPRRGLRRWLETSADDVNALTTAHLNGKLVEALGLLGYLRNYVRAQGVHLWDAEGNSYVDFLAGYGSVPLGHNPPEIVDALREVLDASLPHFVLMAPEILPARLAERLAGLCPGQLDMAFFASSGSEAVDGALKLARAVTHRQRFAYAARAYHGSTFGAMAVTGDPRNRAMFSPLGEHVELPWGDLGACEAALKRRDLAAVILEPIQAEGGVRLPPPGYLAAVAELCRRYGALFILDEIQTGLGRTGALFACQDEGVVPDVLLLAKALSGGMVPASCYLTRPELWRKAYGTLDKHELHCTTFRGGPMACAAALTTIETIVEHDLAGRARMLGDVLGQELRRVTAGSKLVKEVRGRGLLWGIEVDGFGGGVAGALAAQWLVVGLLERGFVTQVCTLAPTVIRVEPSLTIEREQLLGFCGALGEVLREHASGRLRTVAGVSRRLLGNYLAPQVHEVVRNVLGRADRAGSAGSAAPGAATRADEPNGAPRR